VRELAAADELHDLLAQILVHAAELALEIQLLRLVLRLLHGLAGHLLGLPRTRLDLVEQSHLNLRCPHDV
jgi:hypothetical protein